MCMQWNSLQEKIYLWNDPIPAPMRNWITPSFYQFVPETTRSVAIEPGYQRWIGKFGGLRKGIWYTKHQDFTFQDLFQTFFHPRAWTWITHAKQIHAHTPAFLIRLDPPLEIQNQLCKNFQYFRLVWSDAIQELANRSPRVSYFCEPTINAVFPKFLKICMRSENQSDFECQLLGGLNTPGKKMKRLCGYLTNRMQRNHLEEEFYEFKHQLIELLLLYFPKVLVDIIIGYILFIFQET